MLHIYLTEQVTLLLPTTSLISLSIAPFTSPFPSCSFNHHKPAIPTVPSDRERRFSPEKEQYPSCGRSVVSGPMRLSCHFSKFPQLSLDYYRRVPIFSVRASILLCTAKRWSTHRLATIVMVLPCLLLMVIWQRQFFLFLLRFLCCRWSWQKYW